MASVGHVVVGLAAGRFLAPRVEGSRLKWSVGLSLLSLAPDLDVIGFAFGIAYGDTWGHRGATHALCFGMLIGVLAGLRALFSRHLSRHQVVAIAIGCGAVWMSHGLLDALTDGGLGAALGWPFTDARLFFPIRPLPVAPLGLGYLSLHGLLVSLEELAWFLPLIVYVLWPQREARSSAPSAP